MLSAIKFLRLNSPQINLIKLYFIYIFQSSALKEIFT